MNMQIFKGIILSCFIALFTSCKTKVKQEVVYENIIYEVEDLTVYQSNVEKRKQKSSEQLISILYADLFNKSISNKELADLSELTLSVGDKTMANELLLSHFLEQPDVVLPSNVEMRDDVRNFVTSVYIKFFQRAPTEYEKQYLVNKIKEDIDLTPKAIYTGFVLSNEYYFY